MKVKQLIEQLSQYPEDMTVYLYTDHGQTAMICDSVVKELSESDQDYITDLVHEDDAEGDEETIVVIYG